MSEENKEEVEKGMSEDTKRVISRLFLLVSEENKEEVEEGMSEDT